MRIDKCHDQVREGLPKGAKVVWFNLREESVVYINGRPFVLREAARPFNNLLEYAGIDRDRVEKMELRLREDGNLIDRVYLKMPVFT